MLKFFSYLLNLVKPTQFNSWQTFNGLAILFFITSVFSQGFLRDVLAYTSFVCISIGLTWVGLEKSWPWTPWLTAALICLFIHDLIKVDVQVLLLTWLPLAASLAIIPYAVDPDFHWHLPKQESRQFLVILFGSQILLTCWIQFFFILQGWLVMYPSLFVDDFGESMFVRQVDLGPLVSPRSMPLLGQLRPAIELQLSNQDWGTMERWLQGLYHTAHQMPEFVEPALERAEWERLPEDDFWQVTAIASPQLDQPNTYQLRWDAQWRGPRSRHGEKNNPYDAYLICRIRRENQTSIADCDNAQRVNPPTTENGTPLLSQEGKFNG
ncbi:MAG: hypothetical protein EA366_00655 [Spirulina sp. DLM2.Bin59]|nr:MAG: hypothetical protein EA366_00655 [Spirulina sp. DLM2.Bin59]